MNHRPTTLQDVRDVLAPLADIKRPYGDNDGDSIDDPSVYDLLSDEEQASIDRAKATVRNYVFNSDGSVNKRAVTTLCKSGFPTSIGPDQYDALRNVGQTQIETWRMTLSDPSTWAD